MLLALIFWPSTFVLAGDARHGWLQTRDQNPFALATGLPLAPAVPAAGTWQFDTTFNIANTELAQTLGDSSLRFDAETHETRISAAYAFNERWSLRGSIGHLWIGAGFLDGPVERFHQVFGFDNGDRGLLDDQAPSIEVSRNGNPIYTLDRSHSSMAPLLLDLSRQWKVGARGLGGFVLGAKAPLGSRSTLSDSGSTDISLSAFTLLPIGTRWTVGARAGLLHQFDNQLLDDSAHAQVPFLGLLLRYQIDQQWSAWLQSDAHGPLFRDLPDLLDSVSNQLNFGFSRRLGERAELQMTMGEDLPALHASDIVLTFNLRVNTNQ